MPSPEVEIRLIPPKKRPFVKVDRKKGGIQHGRKDFLALMRKSGEGLSGDTSGT